MHYNQNYIFLYLKEDFEIPPIHQNWFSQLRMLLRLVLENGNLHWNIWGEELKPH